MSEYPNHPTGQLHEIAGGLYAEAWMHGLSFRIIAAVAGQNRWDTIYSALVSNACITIAPAGRPPAAVNLPEKVGKSLLFRHLTFRKWCHANGYLTIDVAKALEENQRWAIDLVSKDFPRIFPNSHSPVNLPRLIPRPAIGEINIRPTGAQYEASATGYPGLSGVGRDHPAALYQLIGKIVVSGRILRLRHFLGSYHPE